MEGRYGSDELGKFLLFLALIPMLLSTVCALLVPFSKVFFFLAFALWIIGVASVVLSVCRALSKKVHLRMAENRKYLKLRTAFLNECTGVFMRFKERKTHVYKKCPHCKAILRLPRKPGKHSVTCRGCGYRFRMTVRKWRFL